MQWQLLRQVERPVQARVVQLALQLALVLVPARVLQLAQVLARVVQLVLA